MVMDCPENLYNLGILKGLGQQELKPKDEILDWFVFCQTVCEVDGIWIALEEQLTDRTLWYWMKQGGEITDFEQVTKSYGLCYSAAKAFNDSHEYPTIFGSKTLYILTNTPTFFLIQQMWQMSSKTWCCSMLASIPLWNTTAWASTSMLRQSFGGCRPKSSWWGSQLLWASQSILNDCTSSTTSVASTRFHMYVLYRNIFMGGSYFETRKRGPLRQQNRSFSKSLMLSSDKGRWQESCHAQPVRHWNASRNVEKSMRVQIKDTKEHSMSSGMSGSGSVIT